LQGRKAAGWQFKVRMNFLYAIFMGLIQGITEFLPVSSSGHLAIFQHIFNLDTGTGVLFESMLHLGTLIAVCVVFWNDVKNLVIHGFGLVADVIVNGYNFAMNKIKNENRPMRKLINHAYRKFAALIIVTSVPTAVIGLVLSKLTESASTVLLIPGVGLLITAIELLIVDGRKGGKKKAKATTYKDAAIIGAVQGVATIPGISRSGSTIAACLFLGLDKGFAVKYSFLMSVPAIVGANLLELRHIGDDALTGSLVASYVVGMVVAAVVGYICVKVMINIVKKSKYQYFAYYCAAVGIISLVAYFFFNK